MEQEAPPRIPVPKYQPSERHASEKGSDNMYPFTHLDFGQRDIENRYNGILGPLQLFAPYPHEDEPPPENVILERPVTPINDEIKMAPTHLSRLAKYVRRRIPPKPKIEHLSVDDQKELAAIIMGEINNVWADIRMQVDDPFFTAEENGELQRRITVHIVTVCEQLFNHYIDKAQILNRRGVFSGPANMSRLKAQLALDATKFLNILTIRRYIVNDIRKKKLGDSDSEDDFVPTARTMDTAQSPRRPLSNRAFLAASRPKSRTKRHHYTTTQQALHEMATNMPGLDTNKLMAIVAEMPNPRSPSRYSVLSRIHERRRGVFDDSSHYSKQSMKDVVPARKTSEDLSRGKVLLKRSDSAPRLVMESLLEELGIEDGRKSCSSLVDIDEDGSPRTTPREETDQTSAKEPEIGSREYASEDLKKLIGTREENEDVDEELPPLLQALTRSAKHDNKQAWIEQQLQELEAREQRRRQEESIKLADPTHPQHATVTTRLPNKMFARTSDVRVSERVCLSSITLDKHATVYNDLIDEIDAATVKKLDSNLFLGDEITEVYKEIMKTVPTDHLELENDDMIEPAADSVDLTSALASASLSKPRSERIINPNLQKNTCDAPWGENEPELWARTPLDPPMDLRGRPLVQPMTPRGEDKGTKDFLGKEAEKYVDDANNMSKLKDMGEVMARSYASWLHWWKNTINSDDYIKYLSTQESDYMGVVFHFYNSDDDTEDEMGGKTTTRTSKKVQKLSEERKKKKVPTATLR